MKFKVGDKVRIIADDSGFAAGTIGKTGVVAEIDTGDAHPYTIHDEFGEHITVCNDSELEPLEPAKETLNVEGIARIVGAKVDNIVFQRMGDDVTISVVDNDLRAKGADVITIQQLREVLRIIDAA